MFRPLTRRRERGTAALEALLVMPVIVAVFVLVWDFSAGAMQKARASVAARELTFRHLVEASGRRSRDAERVVTELIPGVKNDTKRPNWQNYQFTARSFKEGFTKSQDTGPNPIREDSDAFGLVDRLLGTLAGERYFEVTLSAKRPFETILPRRSATSRISLDSSPYTKKEYECGYFNILADIINLPEKLQSFVGC